MNSVIVEAASLSEHWRKLYVRTGHVKYLRTAEVLATLRAAIVDQQIHMPADYSSTGLPVSKSVNIPHNEILADVQNSLTLNGTKTAMLALERYKPTMADLRQLHCMAHEKQLFDVAALILEKIEQGDRA